MKIKTLRNLSVLNKAIIFFSCVAGVLIISLLHLNIYKQSYTKASLDYKVADQLLDFAHQINIIATKVTKDIPASKEGLENASNLYDKYFYTLKNGGELFFEGEVRKLEAQEGKAKDLIQDLEKEWNEYKLNAEFLSKNDLFRKDESSIGQFENGKYVRVTLVSKPLRDEAKEAIEYIQSHDTEFFRSNKVLSNVLKDKADSYFSLYNSWLSIYLFLFILFLFLGYYTFKKAIHKNILRLVGYATEIEAGNLNVAITNKSNDELGIITRSLNGFTSNLKLVIEFINKVGSKDFSAVYQVRGEDDDLGISLINMKETLLKAEEENKLRKEEDDIRNWATQGIAKFSDLLRLNNDNLDELSYSIISNLIVYIGANQGGVFIVDEDLITFEKKFNLTASYAFDRRKFHKKSILWGEGLIGRSALERKTLYITEVPDDYLEITSGLGNFKPASILITPLRFNDEIFGVIEIAAFEQLEKYKIDFVEKVSDSIASTISSVRINIRTSKLLEESKEQAERLSQQEEEMRQNMEEMQATQEEAGMRNKELEGIFNAIDNTLGTYELTLGGNYIRANANFRSFIDITENELRRKTHREMVFPNFEDMAEYNAFWKRIIDGDSEKREFYYKIDDEIHWLFESYTPVYDTYGELSKVLVIVNNITEDKRKAESLQESMLMLQEQEEEMRQNMEEMRSFQDELEIKDEQQRKEIEKLNAENEARLNEVINKEKQTRSVLETSLDGVIIIDNQGTIEFFNKAASDLWGYSVDEVIGQKVNMLMPEPHTADHDSYIGNYLRTGEKKIIGKGREVEIKRKDGSESPAFLTIIETKVEDKSTFTAFVKDLTLEKEAKEEQQALMEKLMAKEFECQAEIDRLKIELSQKGNNSSVPKNVLIQWNSSFSVKHAELDEQHKKLVNLINSLYSAFKQGKGTNELSKILIELISYTSHHFSAEEKIMREIEFNKIEEHLEEHKELVRQVVQFQKDFDAGKVTIGYDIMNFLKDWLEKHILESDMMYAEFIQASATSGFNNANAITSDEIIVWKDEFSVSNPEIDSQHQNLIDLINKLFKAFKAGKAKRETKKIINDLVGYTSYHFATEERLFKQFDYKHADEHIREHEKLTQQVKQFQKDVDSGRVTLSYEIMNFLKEWLEKHILESDKKYVVSLTEGKKQSLSASSNSDAEILINWSNDYSLDIKQIDDQHRILVDLINQLYGAFKKGTAKKQFVTIIKGLVDYTDYHFGVEEKYFKDFGYEESSGHVEQHSAFVNKIKEFQKAFDAGEVTVTYDLMSFLKDWLVNHILVSDRKYIDLFKNKGIK